MASSLFTVVAVAGVAVVAVDTVAVLCLCCDPTHLVLGPDTIEETGIGRLLEKVIHSFIKPNMLSFLDSFTLNIVVNDLLHGLGEAKEDADASIGDSLGITTGTIRNGINMAAEGTEVPKVRTVAGADLIWSLVTTTCRVTLYKRMK